MDQTRKMAAIGHFPSIFTLLNNVGDTSKVIDIIKTGILAARKRNLSRHRISHLVKAFVAYEKKWSFENNAPCTNPREFLDPIEKEEFNHPCKVCSKDSTRIYYDSLGDESHGLCKTCTPPVSEPETKSETGPIAKPVTKPESLSEEQVAEPVAEPVTEPVPEGLGENDIEVGQIWEQEGTNFIVEKIGEKVTLKPVDKGRRRKLFKNSLLERYNFIK